MKPIAVLMSAAAFLAGCQNPPETELSGAIQGTTYHIKVVIDGLAVTRDQLQSDIDAVFKRVDEHLSNWRDDSEISRINQQKTMEWQSVSPEVMALISIAQDIHDKTQGCYDLTVKPLFDLWGFARHADTVPTEADIARVIQHVGMDKLELDPPGLRIRKKDPQLEISFDSIAQGYTVGAIARALENRGIGHYLAEIGGEMKVKGHKANGQPWRVAIEKPSTTERGIQRVLDLEGEEGISVMTSGTYRNFFEAGGHSFSHIIDPRSGKPVTHTLLSTTVLHQDPTLADAWSTALLCVGVTAAADIADTIPVQALFIYRDGDQLKEQQSASFPAMKQDLK